MSTLALALLLLAQQPGPDLLAEAKGKVAVLFFLSTDCPISNRFVPEMRRLHGRFAPRGVLFYAVYPSPGDTTEAVLGHVREFGVPGKWLRDSDHGFVKKWGARVTPESVVLAADGRVAYRGRIDDRYTELGRVRARPTQHDLEAALEAITAGRTARVAETRAIGCSIPDLR